MKQEPTDERLLLTEVEKARIYGLFQREKEEHSSLGLSRLGDMISEAQLAKARPIIEKQERERINLI